MIQRPIRKIVVGVAGILMLVLTIGGSATVGAAAPVNGCTLGNYVCTGYTYVVPAYTYANVPYVYGRYAPAVGGVTYFDPRYCGDGRVSIVSDKDGNAINVCTTTGARIFPVYSDYAYGVPYPYYR